MSKIILNLIKTLHILSLLIFALLRLSDELGQRILHDSWIKELFNFPTYINSLFDMIYMFNFFVRGNIKKLYGTTFSVA